MSTEVIVTEQELPIEVIEAIRAGRKVEAIKILRESTGLGLANAKVLVDRAWRTHGPVREIPSFKDEPRTLTTIARYLVILLAAAAVYYFIKGA
mgnify:FL=1